MIEVTFYNAETNKPIIVLEGVEMPENSIVNETSYATKTNSNR